MDTLTEALNTLHHDGGVGLELWKGPAGRMVGIVWLIHDDDDGSSEGPQFSTSTLQHAAEILKMCGYEPTTPTYDDDKDLWDIVAEQV